VGAYVRLLANERRQIYALGLEGLSQAQIARRLGRDKSTVSQERCRNQASAGFLPDFARWCYQARRPRCRPCNARRNGLSARRVIPLPQHGWSPEQIADRLQFELRVPLGCSLC
jgi:IS30 family transposase